MALEGAQRRIDTVENKIRNTDKSKKVRNENKQ